MGMVDQTGNFDIWKPCLLDKNNCSKNLRRSTTTLIFLASSSCKINLSCWSYLILNPSHRNMQAFKPFCKYGNLMSSCKLDQRNEFPPLIWFNPRSPLLIYKASTSFRCLKKIYSFYLLKQWKISYLIPPFTGLIPCQLLSPKIVLTH